MGGRPVRITMYRGRVSLCTFYTGKFQSPEIFVSDHGMLSSIRASRDAGTTRRRQEPVNGKKNIFFPRVDGKIGLGGSGGCGRPSDDGRWARK